MCNLRYISALFILFASCSSHETAQPSRTKTDSVVNKPVPPSESSADTLVIKERAALFYQPDSIQAEKAQKDDPDFYTAADDFAYYFGTAHQFLDSVKCLVIYTQNEKYLKFITKDGSVTMFKKDTLPYLWGVYLFDHIKKPLDVDITNIAEEYNNYFKGSAPVTPH